MPIGTILPYIGSLADIPNGWHLCDGTDGTPNLLDNRFLEGDATSGIFKEPGLPNITGTIYYIPHSLTHCLTTIGVFNHDDNITIKGQIAVQGQGTVQNILFNASWSSPVYQDNCNTVQPRSYTVMYIIKIK